MQFRDSTHANTHILYTCTKEIHFIVDYEEAVVVAVWKLYELDFTILVIVLL